MRAEDEMSKRAEPMSLCRCSCSGSSLECACVWIRRSTRGRCQCNDGVWDHAPPTLDFSLVRPHQRRAQPAPGHLHDYVLPALLCLVIWNRNRYPTATDAFVMGGRRSAGLNEEA